MLVRLEDQISKKKGHAPSSKAAIANPDAYSISNEIGWIKRSKAKKSRGAMGNF